MVNVLECTTLCIQIEDRCSIIYTKATEVAEFKSNKASDVLAIIHLGGQNNVPKLTIIISAGDNCTVFKHINFGNRN